MSRFRIIPGVVLAVLLQACAGGGETGTGLNNGSGGNDVSVGTITRFGSVWVNGVEFQTNATQVKLEGASAATNALKLGMVVTVKGKINADRVSGIADTISVEEVIEGPISVIGANSFTVLGQDIIVNETTLFEDNLKFRDFLEKDLVEVSGIVKSAGVITATRVERKAELTSYKLKGIVSALIASAHTFMIGQLTVNYASLTGLAAGVPTDGMLVEVKGTLDSGAVLVATSLKTETLEVVDADKFEIEGYVGSVSNGGASFTVNNVNVQTSAATEFKAGLITDLVAGAFVEIEGTLQGGVVTASKVGFREAVKLESQVVTKNVDNTLTLAGFVGLIVAVDSQTEYEGATGIADLLPGITHVSVRGRYTADRVIATRIEAESSGDKVVLQGPVTLKANPTLKIMGVNVITSGIFNFDANIQNSFFSTVAVGDVVNVEGKLTGGVVSWESIELEK